jgi:predicted GTPase
MLDQHVVAAIPIDLTRVVSIGKPVVRARYEFAEVDAPGLGGCLDA